MATCSIAFWVVIRPRIEAPVGPTLFVTVTVLVVTNLRAAIIIPADHVAGALVVLMVPTLMPRSESRLRKAHRPVPMDVIAPVGRAFVRRTTIRVVAFEGLAPRVLAQPAVALIIITVPARLAV